MKNDSEKHAGGRPLKFQTAEEIESVANKYFDSIPMKEWTITGLALALDTNRQTLINYSHLEEFFDTIKRIKAKVEHGYELRGMEKGTAFDIFRLKNMGWKDKQEQEISNPDGSLIPTVKIIDERQNT